jgi:K+-transporting ATPase KdpF subunit
MTPVYWIIAVIALALSVYLVFALLKPEWFE